MQDQHKPGTAHKRLDIFAGKWHTTGLIKATAASPAIAVTGTDTYEWLPGGFFLLHKVDVQIGNEKNESTEIIRFDAAADSYFMHYFDNRGNTGTMQATVHNGVWTFLSEALRFTGSFSGDGKTLSGVWEQAENGNWVHWMDIKLTKVG